MGRQQSKGNDHGGVNCNGIVEQCADDLVEKVEIFGVKAGRRVVGFGVFDAVTKDRAVPLMWGILRASRRKVLKFVQGFHNVGRHGNIVVAAIVIPG